MEDCKTKHSDSTCTYHCSMNGDITDKLYMHVWAVLTYAGTWPLSIIIEHMACLLPCEKYR